MSRAADYTIKGFLYQFNKTLQEVLRSPDSATITVEGIVEDVEVSTPLMTKAYQCKYHETSEKFTPSNIFEPVLQMMKHYCSHRESKIEYILFAHFPVNDSESKPAVGKAEIEKALKSKNEELRKLIASLPPSPDVDGFLSRFSFELGPGYDALVDQVCADLKVNGIPDTEIETLGYPNAIHIVSQLSIEHDPQKRRTTKIEFLKKLKDIRKTAISRWTLALRTRKQLLEARRTQLKAHLDQNSRLRYLLVNSKSLDDYATDIVLFLVDYLQKYHFKQAHTDTPWACPLG